MSLLRLFTIASVALSLSSAIAPSPSTSPPNLIIFLADDLGYGDLSSYGHPTIMTPNIDHLASTGTKFTQFYSAYPICTPSRSGLLTGRLPVRNGIFTDHPYPVDMAFRVFLPANTGGLPPDEVTIPQVLKQAGYSSALIGKWHLGHVSCLPTERGFDEFYGVPYAQDEGCAPYYCPEEDRILSWPGVPLYNNTKIIEQPVNLDTLTPRYNERALDFITRNKDNPFFLFMSYDEVHVPLFASKDFINTSHRGLYGDAASEMDASVGLIMKKLDELDLTSNTLVIFTSDNGAWTQKELDGGSNGLLRGQKGETYEGGMRVPAIVSWPGKIPSGKVSMSLGSQLDLIATFAELANAKLPNKTLDSYSLVPTLLENKQSPRETVFYYRAKTLMAIRYRNFKAHFVTRSGWGEDPPIRHDPPILYNLDTDPSELYPLESKSYESVIETITKIAEEHNKSVLPLPKSQLDQISFDKDVPPCCQLDPARNCTCGYNRYPAYKLHPPLTPL